MNQRRESFWGVQREHFLQRLQVWRFHLSLRVQQHTNPITKVILFVHNIFLRHTQLLSLECFAKITWVRAALSSQLVNRPKWLNWRVTFPTQPLPSFLHSQLHCLSWVEQIHRELWPCLCLCPCFCLCLCPCPLQLPLLRRVYPEEAQPVDPVEYKEEAGEETEEHQVHPSSPHLFVLQVLSSDKNNSKVFSHLRLLWLFSPALIRFSMVAVRRSQVVQGNLTRPKVQTSEWLTSRSEVCRRGTYPFYRLYAVLWTMSKHC